MPDSYTIVTGQDTPSEVTLDGDKTYTIKVTKDGGTPSGKTTSTKTTSLTTSTTSQGDGAVPTANGNGGPAQAAAKAQGQLPQTGDENPITVISLGLAGLAGALLAMIDKRKKQH